MKRVDIPTYEVDIVVCLREGYNGLIHTVDEAKEICQNFCDVVGLGITLGLELCIYTSGNEPCVRVHLINYPRFPKQPKEVLETAEELGLRLAKAFKQIRFSLVATDITRMIELDYESQTSTIAS